MPKHKENKSEKYCSHPGGIYIHYDTSCESIPAWQFINAIKSIKEIIDDINNELLDGKLEYEIFIRPPQKGSFLIDIGVFMGGLLALAKALETDLGKAFVEGLTGQKPEYWAKKGGESVSKYVYIFFGLIKGFLEKPNESLKKIGISITKFKKSFKAKNRIYEDCLKNPDVNGIGFDKKDKFPIKRKDIPRYISEIPDEDDDIKWDVEVRDIVVNSPNWERDGRNWQATLEDGKKITFSIEDEDFWLHVNKRDIDPDIKDRMRVQWAKPADAHGNTSYKVVKVISYNGERLGDPLTSTELDEILGQHVETREKPREPDLFSGLNDKNEEGRR